MTKNLFNSFAQHSAFSLVLLAPYINFLKFNDYAYYRPEAVCMILGVLVIGWLLAGLYTLSGTAVRVFLTAIIITCALSFFPDWSTLTIVFLTFIVALILAMLLARHSHILLSIISIVFILGVIFLPSVQRVAKPIIWHKTIAEKNNQLPPVLYLILDEHIGIESIPTDTLQGQQLQQSLKTFYINNNFHLFGYAYSHYHETYNSIPNLLNFTSLPVDNAYFDNATIDNATIRHLKQNTFFELLHNKGYQLRVYEAGDYLDYCEQSPVPIAACYQFPTQSIGVLQYAPLPLWQRFAFLLKGFLLQSSVYQYLFEQYQFHLKPFLSAYNITLPDWRWNDAHVSVLSMLDVFAQLRSDIVQQPAGTVFFAHVFAPHSPYAYDANCQLLPPDQWRIGAASLPLVKNSPASRAQTYAVYDGQVTCVEKQVQLVFAAMHQAGVYDHAIIIVQGDHSSRIALHEPYVENKMVFTRQDFNDYFPTLFAVKAPAYAAAYDMRVLDLQSLLAAVTYSITGTNIVVPPATISYVYFVQDKIGLPMLKIATAHFTSK